MHECRTPRILLASVCLLASAGCVTTWPVGMAQPAPQDEPAARPVQAAPARDAVPAPARQEVVVPPTPAAAPSASPSAPAAAAVAGPQPDTVIKLSPPEAALFVGDSRADVLAARVSGLRVAIVRGGECVESDFSALPPDYMVSQLDRIAGLIT